MRGSRLRPHLCVVCFSSCLQVGKLFSLGAVEPVHDLVALQRNDLLDRFLVPEPNLQTLGEMNLPLQPP